jgi:iron complex outermembrane receptor protein
MICSISFAQNGTFSGKVTDEGGKPLPGVSVRILNTNLGAATDNDGVFVLPALSPGKYTLLITAVGFASVHQDITAGDQQAPLQISLVPSVSQLDAVIVTAQKTEEDIQKIPLSMSALSSRKVEEYRLWNIKDVTAIVPNIYSANPGDNRNVTSIRGITSTSYDPAVATYVDGVNQFTLDTYIAQLFDVERIEVLRGPQGTLYGRNAMAGVINIITKDPGNVTKGFLEANVGNYGQQRYGFGVRTPLIDNKLFIGVAAMYDANNGFYKNVFNHTDFDKKHNITGNYYIKYLATNKLSFTLNTKHSINRNNGAFPLAGSVEDALAKPFEVNQNATTTLIDNIFNNSLNINYAGSAFNFTSLSTYQKNYRYYKNPIDGDFSPIDGVSIINNYGKDWNTAKVATQEFKFTSPASSDNTSSFRWTAGTYLFYQESPTKQATHFGADAAYIDPNAIPGSAVLSTSTSKSKGVAVYGQGTFTVAEKLDITAGARFDYEKKDLKVRGDFLMDGMSDPVFVTQPDTSAKADFHAFSPKVSLSYHIDDRGIVYVTSGRGFRAGGLTPISPDPSQPPLYAYKPEHSFNIEGGLKRSFLRDRWQVNLAVYYINVNDAQVPTLVLPQALTVTRNAGKLNSKGIELEVSGKIASALQVDYSFGLTDATYQSLKVPQNGSEVNLKGNHQIFTPSHTSMLALQYVKAISADHRWRIVVRGEWQNLGEQYFDLGNTIKQSGYSLLNTRFGIASQGFEVMFWGRNLTDEKYIAYAYDFGATHLGNPRNYGVTVRKNF